MPRTYDCPFWKWDEKLCTHCEGGRMTFPNDDAKQDYIARYCANLTGWKDCTIASSLMDYYERTE